MGLGRHLVSIVHVPSRSSLREAVSDFDYLEADASETPAGTGRVRYQNGCADSITMTTATTAAMIFHRFLDLAAPAVRR